MAETPEWLKGHQAGSAVPTKWLPGQSGNPNGRPKGSKNKKTLLVEEFEKDGTKIARVVMDAALAGDMQAANLVLQRLSPPLRSRSQMVQFELDATAPLTQQAQQVLSAVAEGEVDPETGKLLIDAISAFAGLKATDDLEARLAALEGRQA